MSALALVHMREMGREKNIRQDKAEFIKHFFSFMLQTLGTNGWLLLVVIGVKLVTKSFTTAPKTDCFGI